MAPARPTRAAKTVALARITAQTRGDYQDGSSRKASPTPSPIYRQIDRALGPFRSRMRSILRNMPAHAIGEIGNGIKLPMGNYKGEIYDEHGGEDGDARRLTWPKFLLGNVIKRLRLTTYQRYMALPPAKQTYDTLTKSLLSIKGCWFVNVRLNGDSKAHGYPRCYFSKTGKSNPQMLHRILFALDKSPDGHLDHGGANGGLVIQHTCKNGRAGRQGVDGDCACINPDHLKRVTQAENSAFDKDCPMDADSVERRAARSRKRRHEGPEPPLDHPRKLRSSGPLGPNPPELTIEHEHKRQRRSATQTQQPPKGNDANSASVGRRSTRVAVNTGQEDGVRRRASDAEGGKVFRPLPSRSNALAATRSIIPSSPTSFSTLKPAIEASDTGLNAISRSCKRWQSQASPPPPPSASPSKRILNSIKPSTRTNTVSTPLQQAKPPAAAEKTQRVRRAAIARACKDKPINYKV